MIRARWAVLGLAAVCLLPPPAAGHPVGPPPAPEEPPQRVDPIPAEDRDLYHSRVTSIEPPIPGLEAEVLGGDDQLRVTWTGRPPLVIEGTQGEPMLRLSAGGIEINERSPSAYLSGDRYAQVALPGGVDPAAPPRWRLIESPGSFTWYEHRAHWLETERPAAVGDGTRPVAIFHWRVPATLGGRRVTINGDLDWIPDPDAIRDQRSEVSSPLLSALILLGAMALGAGIGVLYRRRHESRPDPARLTG